MSLWLSGRTQKFGCSSLWLDPCQSYGMFILLCFFSVWPIHYRLLHSGVLQVGWYVCMMGSPWLFIGIKKYECVAKQRLTRCSFQHACDVVYDNIESAKAYFFETTFCFKFCTIIQYNIHLYIIHPLYLTAGQGLVILRNTILCVVSSGRVQKLMILIM